MLRNVKTSKNMDVVSDLQDDLLLDIISRLKLREAVKTGVLSRRWRYISACLTRVDFDWLAMFPNEGRSGANNIEFYEECKERFVKGVNQFLQFYKGSNMEYFRVRFFLRRDATEDIDRWISFAVRLGVETLHVTLSINRFMLLFNNSEEDEQRYVFRGNLLSPQSGEDSINLRDLSLVSCILDQDLTDQFSCLRVLELRDVHLSQPGQLQCIFSSCLNLEILNLEKCRLLTDKLCIPQSLVNLKSLKVSYCSDEIEISSTNLTTFMSRVRRPNFSFSSVPKLQKLSLEIRFGSDVPFTFNQVASYHLPLLKTLDLAVTTDKINTQAPISTISLQSLPESCKTAFGKLEHLNLLFPQVAGLDLMNMIEILKACPLLQIFHLVRKGLVQQDYTEPDFILEPTESCVHTHLKEIKIGGFRGDNNHIHFAKYLLKYAVSLKKMVIDPRSVFYLSTSTWMYASKGPWEEEEREKVRNQLQGISKEAAVIIH